MNDNRAKIAVSLFEGGYNCSQAIVLAFKDLINVDEKSLKALSSSFGGGISRLRETCGCVSGMAMVFGLLYGDYDILNVNEKGQHYELVQQTAMKFKDKFGYLSCFELLSLKEKPSSPIPNIRSESYYKNRPCSKYIAYMASIMEEIIYERENKS